NIDGWLEVFGDKFKIVSSIYLLCDEKTCVDRILVRGQSSGRSDDNEETIKKRFKTFFAESLPVIEELRKMGPVIEVSSTSKPEEVFDNTALELDKHIQK